MQLFELTVDPDDWRRYQIEGEHTWSLPPLSCDVCGSRWKTTGEAYPTVDVGESAVAFPLHRQRPLAYSEFSDLRERLRPIVPHEAPLYPGADFGPFTGTGKGNIPDLAWHESWTMFLRADALQELTNFGVRLPRYGTPELTWGGKLHGAVPELVEPEAMPLVDLASDSLREPRQARCAQCGRQPGWFERFVVSATARIPQDVDLFRARNHPSLYLVTERFADAVQALELTGGVLIPLATA